MNNTTSIKLDNNSKKAQMIEQQFEILRNELNNQVDKCGALSNQEEVLELSRKLDKLHNEYIKLKN
ncbi:aspartyl-phosphate phosphatase Spo0E family protein [Desulfuribacillus alkaliarsenatis]|uniref:Uncharacterized protein n=1 Tax=Desulfuribacillus alkaliarsenatis TaxID=766136 RepID=A0A1E5G0R1_9FIRM|nr:aspartyl-phosphate phosphatase Spo0E family protein [Desulfuribacillus alkaliarsenatis]OEF96038.1 hypothetical protein BHF68_09840 [Desulfuribacillus alkaliarsenatis]